MSEIGNDEVERMVNNKKIIITFTSSEEVNFETAMEQAIRCHSERTMNTAYDKVGEHRYI